MLLYFYIYICVALVNACEEHQTCRACIRDAAVCVWCATEKFSGPRCISSTAVPIDWCPGEILNPISKLEEAPHEQDFDTNSENIIQLKPQRINMELRPGQTLDFEFFYNAAEDYPVDMYLMYDATMNLKLWNELGEYTAQVIKMIPTITRNASIGFGTFMDKNTLPFLRIKNTTLSYPFRHQFSLTNDHESLQKAINEVEIVNSTFSDTPTGGLDALAQVLACDEIGWRETSRKIIIFFSDKVNHVAGDGSTAGIINPYDGECYLENGIYTKETEMDYPSTSIINYLALKRRVTVIFVIDAVKSMYDFLQHVINGAQVIYSKKTSGHEESVASEVQLIYEKISKTLKLIVDISPQFENKIDVSFEPDCDQIECIIQQNYKQKFIGKIKVLEYLDADKITVNISVKGIKEQLTLDIKVINECECPVGNDSLCNGGGVRRCGICECDANRNGINCECSSTNIDANMNRSTCIMPTSSIECNGRGSCICGACTCGETRYWGRYCECDDESCPRDENGRLCGHGKCQCGECICDKGWIKNSQRICSCDTSKDRCRTGDNECSKYGYCECNKCKCPANICGWDARRSQGSRCNSLPCADCHGRQCYLLESYALNFNKDKTSCERRVNVTSVKTLENEKNDTTWKFCSDVRYDVGCYTNFVYRYDDDNYMVNLKVQSEPNCVESYYIFGGACLGGLLLIGILTLASWKALTVYRDRKEYRRFKEYLDKMEDSDVQLNPLFTSPNTTVKNPFFRRKSIFF